MHASQPILWAVLISLAVISLTCPSRGGGPATTRSSTDETIDMNGLWEDLQKDEPWNTRAVLEFCDHPAQTVAFFKTHLKPLKIGQVELDKLIQDLASEDKKVWKPAFETLKYYDPRLDEDVETIFDNATDPLQRTRLAAVFNGGDANAWQGWDVSVIKNGDNVQLQMRKNNSWSGFQISTKVSQLGSWNSRWQRADRALVLLQHIGTPQAIEVLQAMATGHPAAQPTQIAKLALESLGVKGK